VRAAIAQHPTDFLSCNIGNGARPHANVATGGRIYPFPRAAVPSFDYIKISTMSRVSYRYSGRLVVVVCCGKITLP
jgi:hypothetical protein